MNELWSDPGALTKAREHLEMHHPLSINTIKDCGGGVRAYMLKLDFKETRRTAHQRKELECERTRVPSAHRQYKICPSFALVMRNVSSCENLRQQIRNQIQEHSVVQKHFRAMIRTLSNIPSLLDSGQRTADA